MFTEADSMPVMVLDLAGTAGTRRVNALLLGGSSLYGIQKMLVGRGLIRDNEDLAHRPALPPAETGAYPVAAPPWAQPWHELRIAAEPLPECAHCLPWTAPGLSITNLEFVPSQDPGWRTASLAMA